MKVIKKNIDNEYLMSHGSKEESLSNGQSITKAIMMGGKGCCGGSYIETAK